MIQKRIGMSPHGFAFSSRRERAAAAPIPVKPAPTPDAALKPKESKRPAVPAESEAREG